VPGVVGVADADFDISDGIQRSSDNIILTDCHDVEAMLIKSFALERVIREIGSESKIQEFERHTGKDVRVALLDVAIL